MKRLARLVIAIAAVTWVAVGASLSGAADEAKRHASCRCWR